MKSLFLESNPFKQNKIKIDKFYECGNLANTIADQKLRHKIEVGEKCGKSTLPNSNHGKPNESFDYNSKHNFMWEKKIPNPTWTPPYKYYC